jgi:Putative auto-transporter adhesin, head GIN domain
MRSLVPLFALAIAGAAPALALEPVPVPAFQSIQLRGGGDLTVVPGPAQRVALVEGSLQYTRIRVERGQLRIDACVQRCPPDYRLRIEVQSPRAPDLAVDGGGQILARAGFAPQGALSVAVNGGGRIDARNIQASSVSAAVNGGGEAIVYPRSALVAAINGGGMVRYRGAPEISSAIHGGGLVRSLQ